MECKGKTGNNNHKSADYQCLGLVVHSFVFPAESRGVEPIPADLFRNLGGSWMKPKQQLEAAGNSTR